MQLSADLRPERLSSFHYLTSNCFSCHCSRSALLLLSLLAVNKNLLKKMCVAGNNKSKRKVSPKKNEPSKAQKLTNNLVEVDIKTMKKPDLILYCEKILLENHQLSEEKRNLIANNQKQIDEIENLKKNNIELKEKCANTPVFLCGDCDYVAECVHDFNDHTHSPENFDDSDLDMDNFKCYFCDEAMAEKSEVMRHTKLIHTSNTQHCNNFLEGNCYYGENCWFLHSDRLKDSKEEFQCKFCELEFKTKNILMKHMKTNHIQHVSHCKNEETFCKYGFTKCWFIHKENIENAFKIARNIEPNINQNSIRNDI